MKTSELEDGAIYAYRKAAGRPGGPIERVRFLGDPPVGGRVGVAFETGERAGSEGEVTLAQLIAPWEEKEAIEAEEAGFDRLAETAPPQLEGFAPAIALMFEVNASTHGAREIHGGVLVTKEGVEEIATKAGIRKAELVADPSFETRDGDIAVGLAHAHRAALAIAELHPIETLEWIDQWEQSRHYTGLVAERYGPEFDQIRRWTKAAPGELRRAHEGAAEEERLRRALLEVRTELDTLTSRAEGLRERIDELLEG